MTPTRGQQFPDRGLKLKYTKIDSKILGTQNFPMGASFPQWEEVESP
jgi:hypothetical protein